MKTRMVAIIAIGLLATISAGSARAQSCIDITTAIDSALKNNLSVRAEQAAAAYHRRLVRSGTDIPQTILTGEAGQINSAYTDTRFGISQSLAFPLVYARQRTLLTEEWKAAMLRAHQKEDETRRMVRQVFYSYLYLVQKKQLLEQTDSLYAVFLQKAELRLKAGEANILEKTTAEIQRGQVSMQLAQLQQDMEVVLADFHLLLHTSEPFIPRQTSLRMELADMHADLLQHPEVKIQEQLQHTADAALRAERAKLLPGLSVAWYNMSIKGTGADDVVYTGSKRFNSVQLGVGLPLFAAAQRARIAAARISREAAVLNYDAALEQAKKQYTALLSAWKKHSDAARYYETTALGNADVIVRTAMQQFAAGEIGYLEWVTLTNQAIVIRSSYLDVIRELNDTVIALNYLLSK